MSKQEQQLLTVEDLSTKHGIYTGLIKKQLAGTGIKMKGKIHYVLHPKTKELIKYGKEGMITLTTVRNTYRLKAEEIQKLIWRETTNPVISCASPMKLYYKSQVLQVAGK